MQRFAFSNWTRPISYSPIITWHEVILTILEDSKLQLVGSTLQRSRSGRFSVGGRGGQGFPFILSKIAGFLLGGGGGGGSGFSIYFVQDCRFSVGGRGYVPISYPSWILGKLLHTK